ncbi:MAG: aminotransferase class IV [Cyclobacteriaceae bacterium]
MLYVNYNGEILENSGPVMRSGNRGYLYGDGLFESIRIINGKPINLKNHITRLLEGAKHLKMRVPSFYSLEFFEKHILELAQKSDIKYGGRCRLSLDRISGGTYSPESNEVEYFIEVYALENNFYTLNQKGLEIDLYMDLKKPINFLSGYKTKNGLIYVLASIAAKEKGVDDFLLHNENGGIIEATSSNIFVVSNGVLYTPGLEEGCLAGTMRMQVINLALEHGIKVYECNLMPQNLLVADEIFLTNAIKGVVWVSGYRTKRYVNTISKRFIDLLNAKWELA